MNRLIFSALVLCLSHFAFGAEELQVAAAADLQFVFPELIQQFQTASGHAVTVSFGSSGNFASQIQNGAPFDLFFSADRSYPEKLSAAGLIEPGSIYHYANGKIVLWTLKSSNIDVDQGLTVLTDPRVLKISIANPEHAPYGRAAVAAMKSAKLYEQLQPKLVMAENISQAAQFVDSGAAEVGFVALSLVIAPSVREKGNYFEVPANYYPPIEQVCVILKSSPNKKLAQQFIDFLKSPAAAGLLRRYGFEVPQRE